MTATYIQIISRVDEKNGCERNGYRWSACFWKKQRNTEMVFFLKRIGTTTRDIESRYMTKVEEGNLKEDQTSHMKKEGSVKRSKISETCERKTESTKKRENMYIQKAHARARFIKVTWRERGVLKSRTKQDQAQQRQGTLVEATARPNWQEERHSKSHHRQTHLHKSNLILKPCLSGCKHNWTKNNETWNKKCLAPCMFLPT